MLEHVVLIGINYQPNRSSGDKNFWVELIPFLTSKLKRISILSIKKYDTDSDELTINGCHISVRYINPKFLETSDSRYDRKRLFWRGGTFPRGLGVIEKLLNIRTLLRELTCIYDRYPFQHVHLMDNMGLGNRLLARWINASFSVSAMAYQCTRQNWLYHQFLRSCYDADNLTVVPYSSTYKEKLLRIGIPGKRVRHIPWGVNCRDKSILHKKVVLDIPIDRPLVLWTGYIQQIQRADFLYAIEIANKAIELGLKATFFFAFKPESFEKCFESFHRPDKGIFVMPTPVDDFAFLKDRCNVLFSPVVNAEVILAPPLSWLEMLNKGVVIVTTHVPGAAEAVINGVTGFVAQSGEELITKLFAAVTGHKIMSSACKEHVSYKYNIKDAAGRYLNLWQNLSHERGEHCR